MKKIINDPSMIVEEMLAGIVGSYPELVHQVADSRVMLRIIKKNKSVLFLVVGADMSRPMLALSVMGCLAPPF